VDRNESLLSQRGSYNPQMILALFALILVVIAGAAAVPVMARRLGRIIERDVGVLGASVLTLGLGGINLVALLWFTAGGEVGAATLPFGAAPMAAGLLGLRVVRGRLAGTPRTVSLLAAAALALAGIPGYFALLFAIVSSAVAAVVFLAGIDNLRRLASALDPRL
jgi:hypothetical protein